MFFSDIKFGASTMPLNFSEKRRCKRVSCGKLDFLWQLLRRTEMRAAINIQIQFHLNTWYVLKANFSGKFSFCQRYCAQEYLHLKLCCTTWSWSTLTISQRFICLHLFCSWGILETVRSALLSCQRSTARSSLENMQFRYFEFPNKKRG